MKPRSRRGKPRCQGQACLCNPVPGTALLTDFGALPTAERNLIRLTFLDRSFRALYAEVCGPRQLTKTYHHPVAGTLELDVRQFSVDTHPDQQLVAYTAETGSSSQEALRFRLQWNSTPTGDSVRPPGQ